MLSSRQGGRRGRRCEGERREVGEHHGGQGVEEGMQEGNLTQAPFLTRADSVSKRQGWAVDTVLSVVETGLLVMAFLL